MRQNQDVYKRQELYNAGIVTEALLGQGSSPAVLIRFKTADPLDIKGITLQFGDAYPVKLTIETDTEKNEYENTGPEFKTEDTFNNTTFMRITPTAVSYTHLCRRKTAEESS